MRDFHVHYTGSLPLEYIYECFLKRGSSKDLPIVLDDVNTYSDFKTKLSSLFSSDYKKNKESFFKIYELFQALTKPQKTEDYLSSYQNGCFKICESFAQNHILAFDLIAGPCSTIDLTYLRLKGMIDGIRLAEQKIQHQIDVRLRLTFIRNKNGLMKNYSNELLKEIFYLLKDAYFSDRVIGFDLSGQEKPLKDYFDENCDILQQIIEQNKINGTHYEIGLHAGENIHCLPEDDAYFYFFEKLRKINITRICHGSFLWQDMNEKKEDLLQDFAKHSVIFDICPTANVRLTPLENSEKIPFDYFQKIGLKYTLNRDNPSIFNNLQHP